MTFIFINHALLVDYGRLQFRFSQVISDLLACKDWLRLMIDFSSKVAKSFVNDIGRFLVFFMPYKNYPLPLLSSLNGAFHHVVSLPVFLTGRVPLATLENYPYRYN